MYVSTQTKDFYLTGFLTRLIVGGVAVAAAFLLLHPFMLALLQALVLKPVLLQGTDAQHKIRAFLYVGVFVAATALVFAILFLRSAAPVFSSGQRQVALRLRWLLVVLLGGLLLLCLSPELEQTRLASVTLHRFAVLRPDPWVLAGASVFSLYFGARALGKERLQAWALAATVFLTSILMAMRALGRDDVLFEGLSAIFWAWLCSGLLFYSLIEARDKKTFQQRQAADLEHTWQYLAGIQVKRRYRMLLYGAMLLLILPFCAPSSDSGFWPGVIRAVGVLLIFMALMGRCWCTLYLGGRKGKDLIDQGPYSVTRNPLYVFSTLAAAGIGAQSGSMTLSLLVAAVVFWIFRSVVQDEELLLSKVFGTHFDIYCRRVPRFIPRWHAWHSPQMLHIALPELRRTLRDALPYFLAIPVFALIQWGQTQELLPVLLRLP